MSAFAKGGGAESFRKASRTTAVQARSIREAQRLPETGCAVLTVAAGATVDDNQNSLGAGLPVPLVPQDYPLLEKLACQNREHVICVEEAGPYDTFTVTNDIAQ